MKKVNFKSMKVKLLAILISIALLPVGILGVLAYRTANEVLTSEFHRSTSETIR